MIHRLAASAFALIIVLGILFLVALRSDSADFDSNWLLEDLTCSELQEAYGFSTVMLDQIIYAHNQCMDYARSPADAGFGRLHCELIEKEGKFVQGMVNDIVDVFNAKPECINP
jgi:hypothetical protein